MLKTGILHPQVNSLLARVRHTNTLVIADRGFPSWPSVETIDLALVDNIPRVSDVLMAILANWHCGRMWMASEFIEHNSSVVTQAMLSRASGVPVIWEDHARLKLRVPAAIGLIRTGDTTPYANIVLESA